MKQQNSQPFPKRKKRSLRHHFIAAWLRSPLKVGAALPSSRFLSRAMASRIDISKEGGIVELGAGTGVVTHAILEAGVGRERLIVIERDKKLHSLLCSMFPELKILCADAMELDDVVKKSGMDKVNAIVSSLPFLTMPPAIRYGIQEQMAKVIGEDGIIIQFTYGLKSPISNSELKRFGLSGKRVRLILANVPPAHVWVYKKA